MKKRITLLAAALMTLPGMAEEKPAGTPVEPTPVVTEAPAEPEPPVEAETPGREETPAAAAFDLDAEDIAVPERPAVSRPVEDGEEPDTQSGGYWGEDPEG